MGNIFDSPLPSAQEAKELRFKEEYYLQEKINQCTDSEAQKLAYYIVRKFINSKTRCLRVLLILSGKSTHMHEKHVPKFYLKYESTQLIKYYIHKTHGYYCCCDTIYCDFGYPDYYRHCDLRISFDITTYNKYCQ